MLKWAQTATSAVDMAALRASFLTLRRKGLAAEQTMASVNAG